MQQEVTVERPAGERTAGDIMQDVVRDLGSIVRGEIQLAKTEMSEKATKAARGGTQLGVAAAIGYLGGAAIVTACIAALAMVIALWAAALVVGVLLCVTALVLFSAGWKELKQAKPVPERTTRSLREDLEWAKQRAR
jgi:Flp pilus assembly protein TadB